MECWKMLLVLGGLQVFQGTLTADDQPQALLLAENGKSTFVIVTSNEPSLEEQTASQWLSETLEQVTGAKFPILAAGAKAASERIP